MLFSFSFLFTHVSFPLWCYSEAATGTENASVILNTFFTAIVVFSKEENHLRGQRDSPMTDLQLPSSLKHLTSASLRSNMNVHQNERIVCESQSMGTLFKHTEICDNLNLDLA